MNWSVFGKAFLVETVYSIPFFILSILPFKKQLRFPIKILILFIFIGQLLQSSLYTYLISHGKPTRVTDTVFAFVSLAIYFLCVKANFWKLLFLGNFILNYFVTVRGIWKAVCSTIPALPIIHSAIKACCSSRFFCF